MIEWLMDMSATWGFRRVFKLLAANKFLPHIRRRVCVEIPREGHFIHQGESGRPIEFKFQVTNPTPLTITINKIETLIFYHGIPIAQSVSCQRIIIPKESQKASYTLSMYWPLLSPLGLPQAETGWGLKTDMALSCYYGDWVVDKELGSVSITGDWEEAQGQLSLMRKYVTGGANATP